MRQSSGSLVRLGAVVDVGRIRCAVDVAPYYGAQVHKALTCENAVEASTKFNLNKYCDKETFQLLSSY